MSFFESLRISSMVAEILRFSNEVVALTTTVAEPAYLVAGIVVLAILPQDNPKFEWWSILYKRSFVVYAVAKLLTFGFKLAQ